LRKETYSVYLFDISLPRRILPRFFSVFDEPGLLGTVCALFISYKRLELKTFSDIIIILSGLVTFSLAFYVVLILNILFNAGTKVRILFVVMGLYVFISQGQVFEKYLSKKLHIPEGRITSLGRTHPYFDRNYESFLEIGGNELIFGRGPMAEILDDPNNAGGSSYKYLIYRHGVLGVFLVVLFFAFLTLKVAFSRQGLFYLLVFLALAYQRTNVFMLFYIVIFIGGLLSISRKKFEKGILQSLEKERYKLSHSQITY